MISFREIRDSFLHLLFPHVCDGCGNDALAKNSCLCLRCIDALPQTGFELHPGNPVEKKMYGRLPVAHAAAHLYFTKESLVQRLIHLLKYKGNKELGVQLGSMMGAALKETGRLKADVLVPLPLFAVKERKRGYNQSTLLCEGMATQLNIPILQRCIIRPEHTETQTRKGRIERWKNMEGKFQLVQPGQVAGKHILLVDDVMTTGATLEACGHELLKAENVTLSIATLCFAAR